MFEKRAHFILALLIIIMPILAGGFYYLLFSQRSGDPGFAIKDGWLSRNLTQQSQWQEYAFSCTSGVALDKAERTEADVLLRQAGWRDTRTVADGVNDGFPEAIVCLRGGKNILAVTHDCSATAGCNHEAITAIDLQKNEIKTLAQFETSELTVGNGVTIVAWGPDSITYKHWGFFADGPICSEESDDSSLSGQLAYSIDTISFNDGKILARKSCTYVGCDTPALLNCE